ncbi:RNA polymerase sigma factor [Bryobacter aggregatus]|uniref:RNA polymerase sigma factor n=1 Tax=Bryobacter aggregatus TaxID=360054 RepID=UPI00068E4228|nr:sigma-70 family RNA polymerase sigma factor [Bryobacter aggregatus]
MLAIHTIDESTAFTTAHVPMLEPELSPTAVESDPIAQDRIDWAALVIRIQLNEDAALEELYALFSRGIKFLIVRQLGRQDIEDRVHDTFVTVVQSIQRGDLRDPARLMGFVRTIVRRHIANFIGKNYTRRRDELLSENQSQFPDTQLTPEEVAIQTQNAKIMEEVLRTVSRRDREILTRFYLLEQSQEQICAEMELNETQFRLLKSRAKQRFSEEGRRRMAKNKLRSLFLRKSS